MAALAAVMGMAAASPAPHHTSPGQQQNAPQTKKDAVAQKTGNNTPDNIRQRIRDHVAASRKGAANQFLNQRQYRKLCRQNPSMYKSKKHRSRN